MGKLNGMRCYLSGSMDESLDRGADWRKEITPKLHTFGVGVFDPCDKPSQHQEDAEFSSKINQLKKEGRYDEAKVLLKQIAGDDFRMVHESSFIILYVDKEVFIFGTPMETAWAVLERKPVLTIVKQGKSNVPNFLLALIPHQMIFSSFNEMFEYLERVDDGKEPELRRWHFFNYDKIYGRKE